MEFMNFGVIFSTGEQGVQDEMLSYQPARMVRTILRTVERYSLVDAQVTLTLLTQEGDEAMDGPLPVRMPASDSLGLTRAIHSAMLQGNDRGYRVKVVLTGNGTPCSAEDYTAKIKARADAQIAEANAAAAHWWDEHLVK